MRNIFLAFLTVLCMAAVSSSPAQVYRDTHAASPGTFIPPSEPSQFEAMYGMEIDKEGNKYVSGGGSTWVLSFSYLAKFDKTGTLQWMVPAEHAEMIAADGYGGVFALTQAGNSDTDTFNLRKFDAATGALLAESINTGTWAWGFYAKDMLIQPDGSPVICGTYITWVQVRENAPKSYIPAILKYRPDLADLTSAKYDKILRLGSYQEGEVMAMSMDTNGDIYFAGSRTVDFPLTDFNRYGIMGFCSADFSQSGLTTYDLPGSQEFFTDIALDPITKVAVASGYINASSNTPLVGTYSLQSSDPFVAESRLVSLSDFPTDSLITSIAASPAGKIAVAVDTSNNGPTQSSVVGFTPDPASPWMLTRNWSQPVGPDNPAGRHISWDIVGDKSGFTYSVLGSSVPEGQQAWQLYSFSNDGAKIDRQVFNEPGITRILAGPHMLHQAGGKLGFFGVRAINDDDGFPAETSSIHFVAQRTDGPDDRYEVAKGEDLTVNAEDGVLSNDGNQFVLLPLTASWFSSKPGLQSVSLAADGSFHATFDDGFVGQTGFSYVVLQNGSVIATNQVKIVVKKPVAGAPVAVNDRFTVAKGSAAQQLNVLLNDTDPEGKPLKVVSVTSNASATISVLTGGKFVKFKPKKLFTGVVTFDYTVRDISGLESTATVTVTVN